MHGDGEASRRWRICDASCQVVKEDGSKAAVSELLPISVLVWSGIPVSQAQAVGERLAW